MKLYIKQKVFSWRDRFTIKDEHGTDVYTAVGEFFTLGKHLNVYQGTNTDCRPVGQINQRLMSFTTRFGITVRDNYIADMVRKITFLTNDYRLEGLPWRIDGDVFAHDYTLLDERSNVIMALSRAWFTWGDSYELDIADGYDPLTCLCIALAVDCCLCVRRS